MKCLNRQLPPRNVGSAIGAVRLKVSNRKPFQTRDERKISMKTSQKAVRNGTATVRMAGKPRFSGGMEELFPPEAPANLIRWPTEQQIQEVSKRLAMLSRMGIRSEANGDYFTSGDLAYQIQEIIHTTEELFKKSQRLKRE